MARTTDDTHPNRAAFPRSLADCSGWLYHRAPTRE
jgi:hypothetical protein